MRKVLALTFTLTACVDPNAGPFEGDDADECRDGADNDRDGLFDCDDPDCFASPDCTGDRDDDVDPDPDSDSSHATDDPEAVADHLRAVTLTYTQTHDIHSGDAGLDALACDSYDLCDCVMILEGTGNFVSAEADLVTFEGSWALTNADAGDGCSDALQGGTWIPEDGEAFHSFRFKNGLTRLDQWMAHANAPDVDPRAPLLQNEQFGIWLMNAPFDTVDRSADHTETSTGFIELFTDNVTHRLQVSFTER